MIFILCDNDFTRLERVRKSLYADALWFLYRAYKNREGGERGEKKGKEIERDEF